MNLTKFKEKLWILILIASLIVIIAIATPAGFCSNGTDWNACWIFGLKIDTSGTVLLEFANEYQLAASIICTFFILLSSIVLLNTGLFLRKNTTNIEKFWFLWLMCGITLIISALLFGIIIGRLQTDYWVNHTLGFAIIGPFISGSISLIISVLIKLSNR
jgi:hypothetical protein